MIILIFIMGLIFGSFYNVCIYRIPRRESIVFPPSHCTVCNHRLGILDLIPVLSFIRLRGRCRYCENRISIQYPTVEVLTAILFLMVYDKYALSWELLFYLILASILLIAAFIDIKHQIIPNGLVLFGLIVGAVSIFIRTDIKWIDSALGMLLGGGSLFLIALISLLILKKEGMGGGDIKLMTVIGIYLGWKLTLLSLILSVYIGGFASIILLASKIKKRGDYIPYGPFIVIGTLISMIWGYEIINWYLLRFL